MIIIATQIHRCSTVEPTFVVDVYIISGLTSWHWIKSGPSLGEVNFLSQHSLVACSSLMRGGTLWFFFLFFISMSIDIVTV